MTLWVVLPAILGPLAAPLINRLEFGPQLAIFAGYGLLGVWAIPLTAARAGRCQTCKLGFWPASNTYRCPRCGHDRRAKPTNP